MGRIKFLSLKRANRNSLTYEYVKPSLAVTLGQLQEDQWGHAILLGGPLQRHEIRDSEVFMKWIRRNSKSLRRQIDLLGLTERDEEYGLILVLTTYTSPRFTDVKFLNRAGESLAPVIMGRSGNGALRGAKWLRGYPIDYTDLSFNGEFLTDEAPEVALLLSTTSNSRWRADGLSLSMATP